jgi:protein TonB
MTGRLNFACSYGSFELKRCYQKNLGWGITLAALLHIIVIGGLVVYTNITATLLKDLTPPSSPPIQIDIRLTPPPSIGHNEPEQVALATQTDVIRDIIASIGIANPVPDTEAAEDATLATQNELRALGDLSATSIISGGGGDFIVVEIDTCEYLPSSGEFVPYDEEPVPINEVKPEYPSLAREAGIEGVVWVEVLVDRSGNVRDVRITKPSGCSAGFEEAATKAAYQTKWKPAVSNEQPVAVRVSYPVRFKLK